eukprot:910701-Pyramimonas_sp.AAC.1
MRLPAPFPGIPYTLRGPPPKAPVRGPTSPCPTSAHPSHVPWPPMGAQPEAPVGASACVSSPPCSAHRAHASRPNGEIHRWLQWE